MSENSRISPEEIAHILAKGANWGLRCEKVKEMVEHFFTVNSWAPMKTPEFTQALLKYYGADPILTLSMKKTLSHLAKAGAFPDCVRRARRPVRLYGRDVYPYIWGKSVEETVALIELEAKMETEVDKLPALAQLEARIAALEVEVADLKSFVNY